MSYHIIEVGDGEPFLVGDRIEFNPAEHGVTLPPAPPGIQERWSRGHAPEWDITIGEGRSNP